MAVFNFDDDKTFEQNLALFLTHMEGKDAQLGAILRAHAESLVGDVASAKEAVRSVFNPAVKTDLDATEQEAGDA